MDIKQKVKHFFNQLCFLFIVSILPLQAQNLKIEFDGNDWWHDFKQKYDAKLYNSPYSLTSKSPHLLWKNVGEGGSLLFDGYSTYMEIEDFKFPKQFKLSFWIAPRAFDNAIDNKLSSIIDYSSKIDPLGFKVGVLKHGQLVIQYGLGKNQKRFSNNELFLKKNEWNYVNIIQDFNSIRVQINGEELLNMPLENLIVEEQFKDQDYILTIGRNSNASGFGDKFKFNMISGLIDEIEIEEFGKTDNIDLNKLSRIRNQDLKKALRLDYSKYSKETFRPVFHAVAPAHWMNEPHAPLYYNGKYHLFYQHNPFGPYWGQIHWGHWVSDDMVNWKHVDVALAPEKGDIDPDGIWSGSAFIGPGNTPMLFYTAGNLSKEQNQQYASIAIPKDTADPYLTDWEKTGVIVDEPSKYKKNDFRDPFVFHIGENYYMIVGSGIEGKGGAAPLFRSKDAMNWEYLHPFYISDKEAYPYLGGMWELPVFLPLTKKDGTPTDKYVFIVLPLRDEADVEIFYWIGVLDQNKKQFVPDDPEPKLMDYGDFGFTGPSGFVDPKTGRTIVFSIAQGKYGNIDTYDMGWAHNAGLPIKLWLNDSNDLRFAPIEEIKNLRGKQLISCKNYSTKAINNDLDLVAGDQLEINMEFDVSNSRQGIEVRRTGDGTTKAMIYYDPETKSIVFDKEQENPELDFKALRAPVGNTSKIKLHVFLDRSMIEIYINDKVSITDRIYFQKEDATGLMITGPGNKKLDSFSIWQMNAIDWKYVE